MIGGCLGGGFYNFSKGESGGSGGLAVVDFFLV
jgi:hypothetical protein